MSIANNKADQKNAFAYLRDKARRAHLDGDGLLVNSLCALALSKAEDFAKLGKLDLEFDDLRWAFVFPHVWLIDDYMLNSIRRVFEAFEKLGRQETGSFRLVKAFNYLFEQPLDNVDRVLPVFSDVKISEFAGSQRPEDMELLTHVIELVWFRTAATGIWEHLIDKWLENCPIQQKEFFQRLKSRLTLQTRLTCPNTKYPELTATNANPKSNDFRFARLWLHFLNHDGAALDLTIQELNATTSPDSPVARLLFDFHHFNRFSGSFGEAQEIGLTRRRALTAASPLLVFQETRESHLSELLGELFRKNRIENAMLRFRIFRLAMLCEISALRLWDWGSWKRAIQAQVESCLEVCKWSADQSDMAQRGLQLAVQSAIYEHFDRDPLYLNGIAALEFAPQSALLEVVSAVLHSYIQQKRSAFELCESLSDLIPSETWIPLAQWNLTYIKELDSKRAAFGPTNPLSLWTAILAFAGNSSQLWTLLEQAALNIARNPFLWWVSREFFEVWIAYAPKDLARKLGEEILRASTDDENSKQARRAIFRATERRKDGLISDLAASFLQLTTDLNDRLSAIKYISVAECEILIAKAKPALREALDKLIERAVPDPQSKKFFMQAQDHVPYSRIDWGTEDLGLVLKLIEAINSPHVVQSHLHNLFFILHAMVLKGPDSFAKAVTPHFQSWVRKPPTGRRSSSATKSPFNTFPVFVAEEDVFECLGWIGQVLRDKLGTAVDPEIVQLLQRFLLDPNPASVPIMVQLCIDVATDTQGMLQIELISICQGLLLRLQMGRDNDTSLDGYIAETLRAMAYSIVMQTRINPRAELLNVIDEKISPLLPKFSRSPNANVRGATSLMLQTGKVLGNEPQLREDILAKLRTDNRARVRSAKLAID